jgi:hypothetical protein
MDVNEMKKIQYLKENYLYLYFNSGTVFFRFPEYIKIFFLYDFLMCASDVVFFPLNFILINFVKLYCTGIGLSVR